MSVDRSSLQLVDVIAGYGKRKILQNVSFKVSSGEIVAIIGPNGCGKTTTLKTITGIAKKWSGEIIMDEIVLDRLNTTQRLKHGLTYCPQGNLVFRNLTVSENIELGTSGNKGIATSKNMDHVFNIFPALKNRLSDPAGVLSGGEQQMVSLARALMANPRILMLDEPSLGLSPSLISDLFERIKEIRKELDVGIIVVEQKVNQVLEIADSVVALRLGKVIYSGNAHQLKEDSEKLKSIFL